MAGDGFGTELWPHYWLIVSVVEPDRLLRMETATPDIDEARRAYDELCKGDGEYLALEVRERTPKKSQLQREKDSTACKKH